MGSERGYALALAAWVAALAGATVALAASWPREGLGATRLVLAAVALAALAGLLGHVRRTNLVLARFAEALRHGDYQARFDGRGGAGFRELADALGAAARDFRHERARDREELRYWEALVDDLPVALLTADERLGVRAANKAARRLFDRHDGTRPPVFATYGEAFARHLEPGGGASRELVDLRLDGGTQRAVVRSATLTRLGTPVRVVAVEPVQAALDAAEVGTQTDLVRVLTHEILNSLTPVVSLAGTAAVLLGEEEPDLAEARLAVTTLARRAEGTRRFIDSYRSLARLPEPRRRRFAAAPFAAELARLFGVEWIEHRLEVAVDDGLVLDADPDLLAQVLVNLLRNAAQATEARPGRVRLGMAEVAGGAAIEVEDDGAGIPAAARGDVFLPFFTTRPAGTGIGLNLARQVAVAHGWRIEAGESARLGGAAVRLFAPPGERVPPGA